MNKLLGSIVAAMLAATSSSASAAVHMYKTQAEYFTAAGPNDTYGFKKFIPPGHVGDYVLVENPLTYGAVTYSSASYLVAYQDWGYYLGSAPAIDLAIPSWTSFALDYGSYFGTPATTIVVNGQSFDVPSSESGLVTHFAGFTSDKPITSVRIEASRFDISIYNFYRSTAVPEPATWAMMIAGFGLVGGAIRRRRTAVERALQPA